MIKLALIDFDSLYYASSKETLEESIQILDEKFLNILTEVKADYYVAFNSNKPYFRNEIGPEYKSTRGKYKNPLKWLKTLKSYSEEKYKVYSQKGVEADDLVAYFNKQPIYAGIALYSDSSDMSKSFSTNKDYFVVESPDIVKTIICSADKDVINLEGKAFNIDSRKWEWVGTSKEEAEDFFWRSMCIGDNADSIKGIPGKGPAFAKKLFLGVDDVESLRVLVFEEYLNYFGEYLGIREFNKNYSLLKMLETPEEYEINNLPVPTLRNVIKVSDMFNNTKTIEF